LRNNCRATVLDFTAVESRQVQDAQRLDHTVIGHPRFSEHRNI